MITTTKKYRQPDNKNNSEKFHGKKNQLEVY